MIQFIKKCWYWFIGIFVSKKNIPDEYTDINKENNSEKNNINIISVKVRYVKEKEN